MKNGFTLIELLAVIVILAIIALIATPIVLGIINDSKNSATIRSAGYYIEAVKHAIMKKNLELQVPIDPKECTVIPNSYIKCDEVELEVEVEGELPDSGSITFESGKTIDVELVYGDRTVIKNSNGELVLETNDAKVCKLVSGEENEIGSKYECEVKPGTKYNFYVLSHEEDGTTNLIMERNICDDGTLATSDKPCYVAWISSPDYGCGDVGDYCSENDKGPVTAMNYLNRATSSWSNIPNLNITYNDEDKVYGSIKLEGKARLPYHREVNAVGCGDWNDLSCPVWMADYLHDAGPSYGTTYQENPIDGIIGYWFLSSCADYSWNTWIVINDGYVELSVVFADDGFGVRPVINLKL